MGSFVVFFLGEDFVVICFRWRMNDVVELGCEFCRLGVFFDLCFWWFFLRGIFRGFVKCDRMIFSVYGVVFDRFEWCFVS